MQESIRVCPTCRANMEFKQGTNKAGKPWAGWFCSDKKCSQEPQWERKQGGSIGKGIGNNIGNTDKIVEGLRAIYKLLDERLPKDGK